MLKKFNFSKHLDDSEAESHRIINSYIRYMLKRFEIRKYNHYIFEACPRYSFYLDHINGLILKAKKSSAYQKKKFSYMPSRCNEIDILAKRFISRKYKIELIYSKKKFRHRDFLFKPFKYSYIELFKDLIFDLKESKCKYYENKPNFNNSFKSGILLLTTDISDKHKPFNNYGFKVLDFLRNSNKKVIIIKPNEIGLTIYDKLKNILHINKFIISKLNIKRFIKVSDLHFIIFQVYNNLYKNKLKKYFLKNKIKKIVSSYISLRYEPIYFEAAKELNINFYCLDYSLGYPLYNSSYLRYLPDTRKFGDIIFANSKFRREMYLKSISFLDNPPEVRSHVCPQADYFIKQKTKEIKNSKITKIAIVDGNEWAFGEDITSLVKHLSKNNNKLNFLLQSKNGLLEREFERLNFNEKNYICGIRGDFKNLRNADLIISIGWQSAALKSAAFFNKPIIFYTHYSYPYKKHIFSFKTIKNEKIDQLCNELWNTNKDFNYNFQKIINSTREFELIEKKSSDLLLEIGFYKNNLEKYFEVYLK